MNVKNIKWDVDFEDIMATVDEWSAHHVADIFDITVSRWADMNDSDRYDFVYNSVYAKYSHDVDYDLIAEIMGLPTEVAVPADVDDIGEYLSDTYGFTHDGYDN